MVRLFFSKLLVVDIVVAVIGMLTLAGWHLNIEMLIHPVKGSIAMNPLTAILFIFCAASKFLFGYSFINTNKTNNYLLVARILAILIIIIAAGKIVTEATGTIYIDSLLYADKLKQGINGLPNIMALSTAVGFLLTGISLLSITLNHNKKFVLAHVLALFVMFISLLSVVAYIFNDYTFYGNGLYKFMSLPSAASFILISICILLVYPEEGFMGEITSKYEGGRIARILIPMALVIPVILGYLRLKGEEAGMYRQSFGIALYVLLYIIIFLLVIWRSAVIINRSNKKTFLEMQERKKTEEALQYRKALLEAQNEAIPDGVLIVNNQGKIISYNHRIAEIWGIPEDILLKENDEEVQQYAKVQLKDPGEFIQRVNDIYSHPEGNSHDEIEFADGRIVERYGNAVVGEDGTRYGWAWYFRDITSQKNSEKKIKEFNSDLEEKVKLRTVELIKSEIRFRSVIENASDIISLSDENGIRFYISPAIEKVTGYSVEETINQPVFNLVHPDDIERTKKLRVELMKEPGVIKRLSCRFIHKNGSNVWIEGSVVNQLHDENVNAVVGNYHDVTETMIAAEKIRLSNERFEIVSKATNDVVWDWNLITDEIHWNDELKSMFDYAQSDIPDGNAWKKNIHPDDLNRVTKKIHHHINNSIEKWQDEYRFLCANGVYKEVFDRGFILLDEANRPYRMLGAMQDITTLHELQTKLNKEKVNKQKELTKASIEGQEKERTEIGRELHDNINQLLTATKLYLDVASTQPALTDDMIKRSQDNVSNCMDEIRKLSVALVAPSVTAHSFSAIIKDLIEPIKIATSLNIQYEVDELNNDILTPIQLLNIYRIIQEHLNNILKHSGASNVFISLQHKEGSIILTVRDDGKGFDVTAKRKGIGFKNILSRSELLNGQMEILSKPGEGCLLQINFSVNS